MRRPRSRAFILPHSPFSNASWKESLTKNVNFLSLFLENTIASQAAVNLFSTKTVFHTHLSCHNCLVHVILCGARHPANHLAAENKQANFETNACKEQQALNPHFDEDKQEKEEESRKDGKKRYELFCTESLCSHMITPWTHAKITSSHDSWNAKVDQDKGKTFGKKQ